MDNRKSGSAVREHAGVSDPDSDWYFDHVLFHAEPGQAGRVEIGPAARWQAWWHARARNLGAEWPALSARATQQGFALTTAQLGDLGVARHVARRLIRADRWRTPQRGAVAIVGPTREQGDDPWVSRRRRHALDCTAAALLNPGHVVTGRSAAVLHGLPGRVVPLRPELTVPRERSTRRAGASEAGLPGDHLESWWGVPVTSVPRTVVDLARRDRGDGLMGADAALRERLVHRDELTEVLATMSRWCGARQAREVLALADPLAESALESLTRLALHDAGFPTPQLQVEIAVPGLRHPYRVDMLWPEQRLILEADGRGKYTDTELWREKKREHRLRALGYRIERVLWSDVVDTWSDTCDLLRAALGC